MNDNFDNNIKHLTFPTISDLDLDHIWLPSMLDLILDVVDLGRPLLT